MANITIANPKDLQKFFEQEPPRQIGERRHYSLSEDIGRISNRHVNKRNRINRLDAEAFPLPIHESLAVGIEDYDLPAESADDFDFDAFINDIN